MIALYAGVNTDIFQEFLEHIQRLLVQWKKTLLSVSKVRLMKSSFSEQYVASNSLHGMGGRL